MFLYLFLKGFIKTKLLILPAKVFIMEIYILFTFPKRLKKEMILRVNTVASEFRKVSNKQMAETTKRAIRENVMINSQLSKMSDKTMDLISENDDIKLKSKTQKQHLSVLEDNEKELIKKNSANQKVGLFVNFLVYLSESGRVKINCGGVYFN